MNRVPGAGSLLAGLAVLLALAATPAQSAPTTGKVRGQVLVADTGEPLSAADVVLLPADSTLRRVGGFTTNDGTVLFEAAPGTYTLQVRAISYRTKRITGLVVRAGEWLPITVIVETEAIEQKEVVVEATRAQNTEKSMLVQRQRAATVGDAVSAEMVRRSPDRDAADVLRRVTGLSVSDGKYVFVRGMGERYSSTQLDGVRLVSPEPNKRVVPLDLVPANLLENVVVQKTHSADRPGEFGGGDVQLRTRDFPGHRTLSLSLSTGGTEGTTFHDIGGYRGGRLDWLGLGAGARALPDLVRDVAEGKKIVVRGLDPTRGFPRDLIAEMGRSFDDVWTPRTRRAPLNGGFAESFGDEWRLFGRPLGLVQSLSYHRAHDDQEERRTLAAPDGVVEKEYDNRESTESVRWGGLAGLSYRLSPNHSLHSRGVLTRNADDETRTAFIVDQNREVERNKRSYRLRYVERTTLNGLLEGHHQLPALAGTRLEWKLAASRADRVEPDRRDVTYYFAPSFYDSDREVTVPDRWILLTGNSATRHFEDQRDRGRGAEAHAQVPFRRILGTSGRITAGFAHDGKKRDAFLRRLAFAAARQGANSAPPESLFADSEWRSQNPSASINEYTFPDDNYRAEQRVSAGFLSFDLSALRRLRAVVGMRVERGFQEVRNFDLFAPATTTAHGELDDVDWLPSANLTWQADETTNLRLGASRTLSRPDLRELSPTREYDLEGYYPRFGNTELERTLIDNYDARVEHFPTAAEVVAFGAFYKRLDRPIEDAQRPADEVYLQPFNSERGTNFGFELEARAGLGRWHRRLTRVAANANFSIIHSDVRLAESARGLGNPSHPLQGQANFLFNGALNWISRGERADLSLLVNTVGRRLTIVAPAHTPEFYEQPLTTVDAVMNWRATPGLRVKVAGKNLLDAREIEKQGDVVTRRLRTGRAYSATVSWGS